VLLFLLLRQSIRSGGSYTHLDGLSWGHYCCISQVCKLADCTDMRTDNNAAAFAEIHGQGRSTADRQTYRYSAGECGLLQKVATFMGLLCWLPANGCNVQCRPSSVMQ
jgi:hypothetical protein